MKVNREQMYATLGFLDPGLGATTKFETACFTFDKAGVTTFNDELLVRAAFPGDALAALDGLALPAEPLLKLLKASRDDEITLEVAEGKAVIKGARWRCSLKTQEAKPLADLPEVKAWNDLRGAEMEIAAAARYASADASMPALCCVRVGEKDVLACDNTRIMQRKLPEPLDLGGWLVQAHVAALLPQYKPTKYAVADNWLRFRCPGVELACRRVVEEYPEAEKMLAVEGVDVTLPESLADALERAGILVDSEFEQDRLVAVHIEEGRLSVSGEGTQGRFEERMKCDAPACSFSTHPDVLAEAAKMGRPVVIGKRAALIKGKGYRYAIALAAEGE